MLDKKTNLVQLQHLVSIEDLSTEEVEALIERAEKFKRNPSLFNLKHPIFTTNLFFENSTRTHSSFEVAEQRMKLNIVSFNPSISALSKGETLYDTVLTMGAIGTQIAVIRHPENEYYQQLIGDNDLGVGIINGGDGSGQHPSQCLLDMMTIKEEFGTFKDLKVAIVGDLTNSRVAKSNMQLLKKLGASLYFSGPKEWFSEEFEAYGQYLEMDELVGEVDVMMMLRVQHERHTDDSKFSKKNYHEKFGLSIERGKKLKNQTIIMHPGPINRDVELASELVECEQSRFVKQMTNGVFVRMAILEAVINGRHLMEANRA